MCGLTPVVFSNDKKEIFFLPSIHKANVINTGKRNRQGNPIRKLQVAFHLIEEAILNAFLLNKKQENREGLLKFKLEAISYLLASGGIDVAAPTATDCLSGHHFLEAIPLTPMKQNPQRCVVCTRLGRRKETRYQCGDCPENQDCAAPCFRVYHTG